MFWMRPSNTHAGAGAAASSVCLWAEAIAQEFVSEFILNSIVWY
jgi:hypothetical protein